ncbi:MAG TPA: hypothetical protein VFM68_00210 [Candidatus Saccharimonadales bacterium]|nr:hypothetical protein [Candidatus Saccharimonadales bacterium]
MNHEELAAEAHKLSRWERHRFMVLVGISIVISLVLVAIALRLYTSSGAAQLDLSRPGYVSVREQASQPDRFEGFPSSGDIDQAALDEFRKLYKSRAEQATNVDSFAGDVMSNEALSIDASVSE